MTKKQQFAMQQELAAKGLRQVLKGQSEILTLAQWTGSTAYVRLFVIKKNKLVDITHQAGDAMGEKTAHQVSKPYGLKRGGYGYGKEFDAVYSLGRALYPKGHQCDGEKCNSNDHSNGDRDYTKHLHSDGGYKFRQQSI